MFTSGDAGADVQHVGYPDFLTIQNSVPMPVTKGEHHDHLTLTRLKIEGFIIQLLPSVEAATAHPTP